MGGVGAQGTAGFQGTRVTTLVHEGVGSTVSVPWVANCSERTVEACSGESIQDTV